MAIGGAQPTRSTRIEQMVSGARSGELNPAEFGKLNHIANDISFTQNLEDTRCECRANTPRLRELRSEYQQSYEMFRHGDYHPEPMVGDPLQRATHNQGQRIYNSIQRGNVKGGYNALDQQREILSIAGSRVASDGGWTAESSAQTMDQMRTSLGATIR